MRGQSNNDMRSLSVVRPSFPRHKSINKHILNTNNHYQNHSTTRRTLSLAPIAMGEEGEARQGKRSEDPPTFSPHGDRPDYLYLGDPHHWTRGHHGTTYSTLRFTTDSTSERNTSSGWICRNCAVCWSVLQRMMTRRHSNVNEISALNPRASIKPPCLSTPAFKDKVAVQLVLSIPDAKNAVASSDREVTRSCPLEMTGATDLISPPMVELPRAGDLDSAVSLDSAAAADGGP